MIKSCELTPFVDSLSYTVNSYSGRDPIEVHEFRNTLLMFAVTALWHHDVKRLVDFDTNTGEFLALLSDNPPMTEWIIDYQNNILPTMLADMRDGLIQDDRPLNYQSLQDISQSAKHLTEFCLPKATNQLSKNQLRRAYQPTRSFFLSHTSALSESAVKSILTMEQWYTPR
ncbi:MAG: hypothetical protein Q4A37_02205 [Candidatus Saccharibacteria bacterium]|nr:hypothetical protein [Candidatus Saccharibacteria bacterium]